MTRRTLAIVSIVSAVSLSVAVRAARSGPTVTLEKARADAAAKAYALHAAQLKSGTGKPESVYQWSLRWMQSEGSGAQAADAHLDRMKKLEAEVSTMAGMGTASPADVAAAAYYRADAEILARSAHATKP